MSHDTFISRFENVVDRFAEQVAIELAGMPVFTYGQLKARALQLAAQLQAQSISPERIVGINIAKSPEYIVAMLGIWYARGAFVPLDPALPKDRLALMCAECQIDVVVTNGEHSALAKCCIDVSTINRNSAPSPITIEPAKAEDLAYVIFTSGSTGTPKGVLVEHKGIINLLDAQIQAFRINSTSRSLFYLSTNFDASISDIGTTLLAGATLCFEPPCQLQPGPEFISLLKTRRITHIDIPPSVLRVLDRQSVWDGLETLIIGGEACALQTVREWADTVNLINVYGPTEATVCTSMIKCTAAWDKPLIGQPLPKTRYVVLDSQMNEVPDEAPGELFIAGIGLARGYLNRPELTASKFVLHGGQRLYKTGDCVVRHKNGEFEFLGRIDRQFKLRGMLIEPDEIEAALRSHPSIQSAVVSKRALGRNARETLIAFILPINNADSVLEAQHLRAHLSKRLPSWMIPKVFTIMPSFPLTATGKPDLDALNAVPIAPVTDEPKSVIMADGSNATEVIAQIFEETLGIGNVRNDDDLFSLGGDSFNVLEVALAAATRGLSLSPALIMSKPRVCDLAAAASLLRESKTQENGALETSYLRNDVRLTPTWIEALETARAQSGAIVDDCKNILLTGATGFLGSRAVHELIERTSATIYCPIRCNTADEGLKRFEQALMQHNLNISAEKLQRVIVIPSDLGIHNFGLNEDQWTNLANSIDTIFHCAAHVNMLLHYQELRRANVEGTMEIARFQITGRRKHLHYASTLSVFVATDHNSGTVFETDELEKSSLVFGGYAQTKWAAEAFLRDIEKAGAVPVSHYRFGLIVGDSVSGRSSPTDFLQMFARGITSLKYAPIMDSTISVDVTPIDFAAKAMVHLALNSRGKSKTYHIANPHGGATLSDIIESLVTLGAKLETLPTSVFRQRVQANQPSLTAEESTACMALCRLTSQSESEFSDFRTMDLFQATDIVFDMTNTMSDLQNTGIVCPIADQALLTKLFSAVVQNQPLAKCQAGHT